jgi:hypothetical protein
MSESIIPIERRTAKRRTVFKLGRVLLNGSNTSFDCVIRDLSEAGAQIGIPARIHLPNRFRLHVVSDGTMVPVRFAWRGGDRLGISFEGEVKRAPSPASGSGQPAAVLQSA